jgi:organic hydroperoxide reductase OsmC/OhrA
MAEPRPKIFEYAIELDRDGRASIPGGDSLQPPDSWTADHLLLTALLRCSIDSLAYHARRAGSSLQATGSASGRITRRESDGRYAFVEIDCKIEAELEPPSTEQEELAAKAERDCFVGASLTVKPRYEWRLG